MLWRRNHMKLPFGQRLGVGHSNPVDDDFPESARIALSFLLADLVANEYIDSWAKVYAELQRTGRLPDTEDCEWWETLDYLRAMDWIQVYTFCERVHDRLLSRRGYLEESLPYDHPDAWVETESLSDVRAYYTEELNNILAEENIGYVFVNGQFQRRGRPQTQKNIQRMGAVLANPQLTSVRVHFNKARKFFDERPQPDVENCVKEAVCALEAAVEILTGKPASKSFDKVIRQLQGTEPGEIPPPIAGGIIKLRAYRGGAQGVAHAALDGNVVSKAEGELVLSVVAAYITYLYGLLSKEEEDIPF
jgi:hypothetical protein